MSLLGCDTSNDIVSIGRSSKAKLFLSVAACAAAVYTGLLVALELGTSRSIGLLWLMVCIKPIPCLAFAAVAWTSSGVPFQAGAIAAGLIAGAIGDFLLSFPKEDLFIPGLIAFAVGHIAYIVAFSRGHRFATHRIVPWALIATAYALVLLPALPGRLVLPVLAYLVLEAAVGWRASALIHDSVGAGTSGPWLATLASASFMASDGVLAIDRFVSGVPRAGPLIMATYWAAQGMFALCLWAK